MIEISFTNHKFNKLINKKYPKRIPIVKKSSKTFKQKIVFNFSEDFRLVLKKNSLYTTNLTKNMIDSMPIEYFPKMKVKRFFFSKVKENPDINKLYLGNCDLGKKSMKYLSYFFKNKN